MDAILERMLPYTSQRPSSTAERHAASWPPSQKNPSSSVMRDSAHRLATTLPTILIARRTAVRAVVQ